jgi:hypothetical protein
MPFLTTLSTHNCTQHARVLCRWHSDEGGDRRLSTRFNVDDSYSRFHIERTAPDVFRIRVSE